MNPEELKGISVLQSLDSEALAHLAAVMDAKDYGDGATIFAEGDPGDSIYFITQGCIRIEKRALDARGSSKTLALLEAGDFFGEVALVNDNPRAASARASGGARVVRLSKSAFEETHRACNLAATNLLLGMIRTASERIRWLSTQLLAYDEVGRAIGDARDLQSLLDLILEELSSASGADWSFLALRSEFTGQLDLRARRNLDLTTAQSSSVRNGEGFVGPLLRNPQGLVVTDFDQSEPGKAGPRLGFEPASLVAVPILVNEQILGLIVLGGKEQNQFGLNTLNFARGIAREAAQAILNTRMREEDEARFRRSRNPRE
jgi:CRP/FNR family transcriptional regulator, cyclic AMP receptor protein